MVSTSTPVFERCGKRSLGWTYSTPRMREKKPKFEDDSRMKVSRFVYLFKPRTLWIPLVSNSPNQNEALKTTKPRDGKGQSAER